MSHPTPHEPVSGGSIAAVVKERDEGLAGARRDGAGAGKGAAGYAGQASCMSLPRGAV